MSNEDLALVVNNEYQQLEIGKNRQWKVLFCATATTVQAALLIKCPLFILRQISPFVFLQQACPAINGSENATEHSYLFTMVIYNSMFLLRWIEALVLHIHMYRFFFNQPISAFLQLCKEGLSKRKIQLLLVALALYLLVHCLSIPALGIILELKHGEEANCEGYVYEHHTVYWILDVVRYLHDVAIRLVIFLATVTVGAIWSRRSVYRIDDVTDEPSDYEYYLNDKAAASQDHKRRTDAYTEKGCLVKRIHEIFQTWFTIPWILYFIASSLESDIILKAWKNGPSTSAQYDFSEVTFVVYNFNQIFLLALPYLCAQKMNACHHRCFNLSRSKQLVKFKTASRIALACMNRIEKEEHYNFIPRIWGTGIKIHLDNPLYVVFLLVGIFFTIISAL